MNLYRYKKSPYTYSDSTSNDVYLLSHKYARRESVNLRYILSNSYDSLKNLVRSSGITGIIIPLIFVFIGGFFIIRQFFPEIKQLIEQERNYLEQGNVALVTDSYINYKTYISNPAGLAELTKTALKQNILAIDTISLKYEGTFYISIPSLNINRLPVKANVDSTSEDIYNKVLEGALAHFKSTSLPISEVDNNMVVYGHSASLDYNPSTKDPQLAFSFIPDMKIGDSIIIEMEGKTYQYKMYKGKQVLPTDTSIITGEKGKRTLTLFTCYPLGNNTHRYVVVAREV